MKFFQEFYKDLEKYVFVISLILLGATRQVQCFTRKSYISPLNLIGTSLDLYKSCNVGSSSGRCVFSLSCLHSGGIHLGVCRHSFLFGSCCKLKYDPSNQNLINHNGIQEGDNDEEEEGLEAVLLDPEEEDEEDSGPLPYDICGTRFNDYSTPDEILYSRRNLKWRAQTLGRILGGEPSRFGAWPWQISLRLLASDGSSNHRCGAVLISDSWAITAAHCVHFYDASEILLRIGDHNRETEDEPLPHMDRLVFEIFEHPDYNPRSFENDIALIYFNKPVIFLPHIRPLCLPKQGEKVAGKVGYVTGWGEIWQEGPKPPILHEVSVPIIDHDKCTALFKKAQLDEIITDVFICAGEEEGGKDACEGDSGGPLVIESEETGRWILAGIISWGRGCGEKYQPGVYTRVPLYVNWVKNKITNHHTNNLILY